MIKKIFNRIKEIFKKVINWEWEEGCEIGKKWGINVSFSFSYFGFGLIANVGDFTDTLQIHLLFFAVVIFYYREDFGESLDEDLKIDELGG